MKPFHARPPASGSGSAKCQVPCKALGSQHVHANCVQINIRVSISAIKVVRGAVQGSYSR